MESALYDYIFGKNRSHAFTDKIIKKQVKVADLETEISILKNKINELKNNLQITQDESSHFHDLAQSMRLKNRLKRMTPKFIRKFLSQKR
jgi:predicted  nucleic acid-binding Zn-ribbon protein